MPSFAGTISSPSENLGITFSCTFLLKASINSFLMLTPPPIITCSGLKIWTSEIIPSEISSTQLSTTCLNRLFSFKASNIFLPLIFSSKSLGKAVGFSFCSFETILTSAVVDAYLSRQPTFPHEQLSPSPCITICPISPASPLLPSKILSSTIMPPPTPVPMVIATIFL